MLKHVILLFMVLCLNTYLYTRQIIGWRGNRLKGKQYMVKKSTFIMIFFVCPGIDGWIMLIETGGKFLKLAMLNALLFGTYSLFNVCPGRLVKVGSP